MSNSSWPMNCSQPDSSVHGMLPARIMEWIAIPFSRGSSHPKDGAHISYGSWIVGIFFTAESYQEAQGFAASCCKKNLQKFFSDMLPFTWNTHHEHTFLFLLDIFNQVMNMTDHSSYWLLFFFLTIYLLNTCWFLLCGCFHSWNILQLSFWWPYIWKIVAGLFFVY